MRWLVLFHRYAGIVLGILMALWCLSGVVMMYVGYPELQQAERLRALPSLDLHACCVLPDDAQIASFQLEMLAGRPVARLGSRLLDLTNAEQIDAVTPQQAQAVAAAPSPGVLLDYDQWTVAVRGRPLYRFALGDAAGTEVYVSQRTGRLVQTTTARQRFWNWLGAVPHWLYFAQLRHNARCWTQIVVWTSFAGCWLAATGIWLGVQRFLRRPAGRWSPYRGLMLWHHVPGFIAGVFALTWVASGLISMNPWGFLDSSDDGVPSPGTVASAQLRDALAHLPRQGNWVSVDSSLFDGQLYLIAATSSGQRTRFDTQGMPHPLTASDVKKLTGTDAELLMSEDPYYFSHHRDIVPLPVYRVILEDAGHTRYYIDPVSGAFLRRVDGNSRWYRWLHQGLHRMDFTPALRQRPLWDVLMWVLMSAVATISCTGAVLGIRRLLGQKRYV